MANRDRILDTALELFYQNGYENTGVQEICVQSGITKPTLYHYFDHKKGLLKTILEEGFTEFWPSFELAIQYDGDITERLQSVSRLYFRFAEEHPMFYQWYLGILQSPRESDTGLMVAPILQRQWKGILELFEKASQDHGNMKGREKRYTMTFLGMINACITTSFYDELDLSEESAFLACKQFMHGIFS
jgi:AcrR family transcriptional regulator